MNGSITVSRATAALLALLVVALVAVGVLLTLLVSGGGAAPANQVVGALPSSSPTTAQTSTATAVPTRSPSPTTALPTPTPSPSPEPTATTPPPPTTAQFSAPPPTATATHTPAPTATPTVYPFAAAEQGYLKEHDTRAEAVYAAISGVQAQLDLYFLMCKIPPNPAAICDTWKWGTQAKLSAAALALKQLASPSPRYELGVGLIGQAMDLLIQAAGMNPLSDAYSPTLQSGLTLWSSGLQALPTK